MADETKIIRIVIDSSKAVDGSAAATRALANLERSAASMDTALSRMEKGLGGIATLLKANLALMVADIAARMIVMAKGAFDAAAGMDELAEQLGVTAKGLQGLQFSAVQNGVKLEQLETGLGKFSQKMGEAAGGSKEMIEALDRIGVKILDANGKLRANETLLQEVAAGISAIDDPARRAAAAVDFFSKSGTRLLPMLKDMSGGMDEMAAAAKAAGAFIEAETVAKFDKLADSGERAKLGLRGLFAEAGAGPLTATLEAINSLMGKLAGYLRAIKSDWTALFSHDSNAGQKLDLTIADRESKIREAEARIAKDPTRAADFRLIDQWRGDISGARREQARIEAATGRNVGLVDDVPRSSPLPPPGARNPGITGAGQGEADRIAKLVRDTGRDVAAATAYADASERGARAVADLETHFKALKSAQDAYGNTADKNTGQVAALTAKIEEQLKAADKLKNLKDFNLGTEELEKSNELLAAENALINASVEDRAREIALIKLKQDVQSKGLDESNAKEKEAIDRRAAAIGQNERLKAQGEEMKKANELWTEPLKGALQSIQSTAADAFEGMLESGKFSFQALGDVVKKTVIRMIAEFAALAVVRPIMGSLIGGLQGIGLVSGSTASSLGFGGSSSGGFSMPSFGGAGGSSLFGFLNNPITGGGIDQEIANWSTYGTSAQNSLGGALGGLTWGQGLAGAASIGMGAYGLATSKSTAGKIGGGLGILGGGVGLASAAGLLPMLGAAGGPIGMGIGLIGSLLPMLLGGGEEYKWDPLAGANARFDPGAGGYSMTNTQQLGGKSTAGQYGGVSGTIDALFKATGGKVTPGMAMSGSIWNNQREGTTSTYVISPTQGSLQLSEGSGDQSAAVDRMIAKMFYMTATTPGALTGASPTLMTALGNKETTSTAAISSLLELVKAYDALGKTTGSAETAIKGIATSFEAMTAGAKEYGLALAPIEAEQAKQTKRTAQDFIDNMLDPLAAQLRSLDDQRKDSLASAEYIRDNVKDVYVDMARIAEYWTNKEADLREQFYAGSVSSLQNLIRRLTYGDLANASPDTSLSGTRGTYTATLAQARAGSSTALNNLAGYAESYASTARGYFASSPEYAAIVEQIRRDLEERVGATGAGGTGATGGASNNDATNAVLQSNAELRAMVGDLAARLSQTTDALAAATAQMQRRA